MSRRPYFISRGQPIKVNDTPADPALDATDVTVPRFASRLSTDSRIFVETVIDKIAGGTPEATYTN